MVTFEGDNGTYCPRLWKGVQIDVGGELRPCCLWSRNIGNITKLQDGESIGDVFDSNNYLKDIRKRVGAGEQVQECEYCYREEKYGEGWSTRKITLAPDSPEERFTIPDHTKIAYLDFRPNNTCNLSCRMCGPGNSTTWQKNSSNTVISLPLDIRKKLVSYVKEHISELKEIYFAGGEPLLCPEHWEILEFLQEKKIPINIRYNTNMTVVNFRGKNIFDYWERHILQGGSVDVALSLDGVGPVAEYVRRGCKWSIVDKNLHEMVDRLDKYRGKPGFIANCCPCISILNVLHIRDLQDYLVNLSEGIGWIAGNILRTPEHYNLRCLPNEYRKKVLEILKNGDNHESDTYGDLIRMVESEFTKGQIFLPDSKLGYIYDNDLDFNIINPELKDWWKYVNV